VWRRGEVYIEFRWGILREIDHLEGPGIDGRIVLKWVGRDVWQGKDWFDLAENRDRWRTLANTIMNLPVP